MNAPLAAGVVLAGGHSRRMGVDKASLLLGGRTLLRRAVDTLVDTGCWPVVVLHREPNSVVPLDVISLDGVSSRVAVRRDLGGGEGPLDGLVTALSVADAPVVVTMPVDVPLVQSTDLGRLIVELERSDLDAVALSDGDETRQHLAAAWRRERCLPQLRSAFERGERSPRRAVADLTMGWIGVARGHLLNVNTPDDLTTIDPESYGAPSTNL